MHNSFSGSLPAAYGQLTELAWLGFNGNSLSGSLPNTYSQLTKLTVLACGNTTISGSLPDTYSQLTNLTLLYLTNNFLSLEGGIPPALAQRLRRRGGLGEPRDAEMMRLATLEMRLATR